MRGFRPLLGFFSLIIISALLYYVLPARMNQVNDEPVACAPIPLVMGSKSGGFASLTHEYSFNHLNIDGSLPRWLTGKAFFVGPAQFELGSTSIKYWYNGLAMAHSFTFLNAKSVSYTNKFIRGTFYQNCKKRGKFDSSLTESSKKPSLFSKLSSALAEQDPYDNANLGFWCIGTKLCAITETPLPIMLDPQTLATRGCLKFNDALQGHITTAQPQYDQKRHTWYNVLTELGNSSTYYIYSLDDKSYTRKILAKLPRKKPSYMRTFGMTDNYILILEQPFTINPIALLTGSGFLDAISWNGKEQTQILIIDKNTGTLATTLSVPAFFTMNVINAYEQGSTIMLDLIAYRNPAILEKTRMNFVRSNQKPDNEPTQVNRLHINLSKKHVSTQELAPISCEMPVVNPHYKHKDYSFFYAQSNKNPLHFPHQLVKVNIKTGTISSWESSHCYPSRPLFVSNPQGKAEDDGVLLSVVYNGNHHTSFLLVLDAKSFKELAKIHVPHHIPHGLSGVYYPQDIVQNLA